MAKTLSGYISNRGEYLIPIDTDEDNVDFASNRGVYYKPLYSYSYDEGNSLGLLLALTYTEYVAPPATEVGNPLGLLLSLTYAE